MAKFGNKVIVKNIVVYDKVLTRVEITKLIKVGK